MLSSSLCERVLSRALAGGGTFAEIFYEDTRSFGMVLRSGRIENAATSRPRGAGIRIYDGLRSIYVYTCDVTQAGLLRAAERAAAAVTDTKGTGKDIILHEKTFPDLHPVKTSVFSASAARLTSSISASAVTRIFFIIITSLLIEIPPISIAQKAIQGKM